MTVLSDSTVSALTPHAPISIVGNSEFTPANGVTSGSGTEADPYVIEGWSIDSSNPADIYIRDTDASFILRNVSLTGAIWPGTEGVRMDNVSNGRIENVSFWSTSNAIHATAASRLALTNLSARDSYGAVVLDRTVNVTLSGSFLPPRGVDIEGNLLEHFNSLQMPTASWTEYGSVDYFRDCDGLDIQRDGMTVSAELLIVNCTNVRLSKIMTDHGHDGVLLAFASGVLVSDSTLQNSVNGIRVYRTSNVTVQRTHATFSTWGILLDYSRNVTILDSRFDTRNAGGVGVAASTDVSMVNNTVVDNGGGIILGCGVIWGSPGECNRNVTISQNRISSNPDIVNPGPGVLGWGRFGGVPAENITISGNTIYDSSPGLQLDADGLRVFHNLFLRNGPQALNGGGVGHAWDDGYPSGGNVWSDYGGVDLCSGRQRDTCNGPDGIGDTPYEIDENNSDRYPLMTWRSPTVTSAVLEGPSFADLTLTWRKSTDEGFPGGTRQYEVMRATAPLGPYFAITTLAASGSTLYSYTCVSCGNTPDPTTFFFKVLAVDASNNTADSNSAARLSRAVDPGENLLGIPVLQANWSVAQALQTIAFDAVRTYRNSDPSDPWKAWYASRPGDLAAFKFGDGFWVNVTAPGQFTVAGLVAPNPAFPLTPGWNLVSYAGFAAYTRGESLAGVAGVRAVEGFDVASVDPYMLRVVPGSEVLRPGEAYWIWIQSGLGGIWVQG